MNVLAIDQNLNADEQLTADETLAVDHSSIIEFPMPAKQDQTDEQPLPSEQEDTCKQDETDEQPLLGEQHPLEQEQSDEQTETNKQDPSDEPKPTANKQGKDKDELTKEEKAELDKLENTIKGGQTAFFKTCEALRDIESKNLFRPEYRTIAEYCTKRWEMTATDVSRYRNAGKVLKNLEGFETLPKNEAQARELAKIEDEEIQHVWQEVLDSGEDKITAKLIARIANPDSDDDQSKTEQDADSDSTTETDEKVSPVKSMVAVVQSLQVIEEELGSTELDEEQSKLLSEQVGHLEDLLNNIRAKIN